MGKNTQIALKSKDCNDLGFPKMLGVYLIGEAHQVEQNFKVSVPVLRENQLQLQASSAEAARILAINHYRELAAKMKLAILITELPDMCEG